MRLQYIFFVLIFGFSISSCVRVPGESTGSVDPEVDPFTLVDDLVSDRLILNAKSNGSQLHVISEGEYFILNKERRIIENFIFRGDAKTFGTPAFSNNVFVRVVAEDGQPRPDIEFRATKNPTSLFSINEEDISETPDESLEIDEFLSSENGAFNTDNTHFVLVTISRPKFEYKLVRFKVTTDASTNNIDNVEVDGYATLKDIDVDNGAISSIKYFGNEIFIASRNGTFRVTENGLRVQEVSPFWSIDLFRSGGNLYSTAFNTGQMLVSEDNGRTWDRSNILTDLGLVRVRGTRLISQATTGSEFFTPLDTDNIFETASMKLNPAIRDNVDNKGLYRAFEFFNGEYYFSVGKELYFADDIIAEE